MLQVNRKRLFTSIQRPPLEIYCTELSLLIESLPAFFFKDIYLLIPWLYLPGLSPAAVCGDTISIKFDGTLVLCLTTGDV